MDVKVLIDGETLRSYPETIEFLKDNGINVGLDESDKIRTRVKMIIVDGKMLYIGSHNWTESALKYNREAGLLLENGEIVEEAESYFLKLWEGNREIL